MSLCWWSTGSVAQISTTEQGKTAVLRSVVHVSSKQCIAVNNCFVVLFRRRYRTTVKFLCSYYSPVFEKPVEQNMLDFMPTARLTPNPQFPLKTCSTKASFDHTFDVKIPNILCDAFSLILGVLLKPSKTHTFCEGPHNDCAHQLHNQLLVSEKLVIWSSFT